MIENWTPNHLQIPLSFKEQLTLPLLNENFSLKLIFNIFLLRKIFDFRHLSPSSEKQLILFKFFCSLKNSTENFGGLLLINNFSSGINFLYCKGWSLIKNSNLFKSPYFSLIGNLGSSYWSLLLSITPECWPKENLKFLEIYFFIKLLYSPNG